MPFHVYPRRQICVLPLDKGPFSVMWHWGPQIPGGTGGWGCRESSVGHTHCEVSVHRMEITGLGLWMSFWLLPTGPPVKMPQRGWTQESSTILRAQPGSDVLGGLLPPGRCPALLPRASDCPRTPHYSLSPELPFHTWRPLPSKPSPARAGETRGKMMTRVFLTTNPLPKTLVGGWVEKGDACFLKAPPPQGACQWHSKSQ